MPASAAPALAVILVASVAASACDRQPRAGSADAVPPGSAATVPGVRQIPLRPGMPASDPAIRNPFAGVPQEIEEGRRLYNWMNCSGCHFEGGGGIGPALLDDDWIYGGRPDQIFDSIVNGRANGMPAYGDKLVASEVWRIVAHVETLGDRAAE